jgi:serine protease Do
MSENEQNMLSEQTRHEVVKTHRSTSIGKYVTFIFLLLVACFCAGIGGGYVANRLAPPVSIVDRNTGGDGNAIISKEEEDISGVAAEVGPSVVSITTTSQRQSVFGDRLEQGAGSGIILTKDGWVLTNKHVVADSGNLSIVVSNGTVYEDVEVIGTDPLNDLAFLKINGVDDLKPAQLGDSSSVRIGQKVVAIGNSLGEFQNTVTSGIISGTGRPIYAQEGNSVEALTDLLQTDAAINPGNSGGPLVNLSGQVIGVNTAIAEDAQSIGFSIPINSAKGMIKHLKETGEVKRAFLGINYVPINPEIAKEYDLPVKKGAYVFSQQGSSVVNGSPADKAGIKQGDIITKVGDLTVGEKGGVASLVSEYAPGQTIQVTFLRDGKKQTVKVTLVAYKQQ